MTNNSHNGSVGEILNLRVLGKPAITINGESITHSLATKEQALLIYLAITGETHSRHALAGLFWGDTAEPKAKTSLRVALNGLRKKCANHLVISRQTVAFDFDSNYRLDTAEFERASQRVSELVKSQAALPTAELKAYSSLYRGDFLDDFFIENAPAFEDWLLNQRGYYQQLALRMFGLAANHLMGQGEYQAVVDIIGQWLAIEPWDEAAHRLMMLAQSRLGNFNGALAQYEQCYQLLEEALGVEPMPETTALYERIQLARQTRPFPLPAEDTPLVGRQAELRRLHQMLKKPDCRLVTITGLGGAGKTRLALAAAHQANREGAVDFLNGVVFIRLASLTSGRLVPFALADALELFLSGQSDPFSDVLNFLAGREMLLIFDNFEQLQDGIRVLSQILEHCPGIKMLVTSREPLQLATEWRFKLEGLSHPSLEAVALDPTTAASYEAVQLFIQAAQQIRPNFQLTPENTQLIQRLCGLVDGMPLALRLSATWLRAMSFNAIVDEVERGLDILETTMRDVPERQRSMRVIFSQAWSLLSEVEQQVFPAFSVFRGGFTIEAVTAVTGAKPWLLARLVDRGLLQLADQDDRYSIHELARQFAAEKLDEAGQRSTTAERHSDFYLGLIARFDPAVSGAMRHTAVVTLRPDFDNIRQAWRWALTAEKVGLLELGMDALAAYYEVTGLFDEALHLFSDSAKQLAQSETANGPLFQITICRLLVKEMEFAQLRGDYDRARAVGEKLLGLSTQANALQFQGDVYRELGILERWSGQLDLAEGYLRKAAAIYETLEAEWPLATTLDWLGLLVSDNGNIEEALLHLNRAAALHTKVNNQRGQVFNKGQRAIVMVVAGRLLESLSYQLEVLDEFVKMGYPLYIARTANNIGLISIELGEYEDGLPYMDHALELQRQTGSLLDTFNTLGNKGELHLNLGQYHTAQRCFDEARQYFKKVKATLLESGNLWRLAKVHLEMGHYDQAQKYLNRCLKLTPISVDVETNAFANSLLAQSHWRRGEIDQAARLFDEAAVRYDQVRRPLGLAEYVHIPRGLFLIERGDVESAVHIVEEMEPLLNNAGRNPAIFLVKQLQAKILVAGGKVGEARAQLEALLAGNLRPFEQAVANYDLWRLTGQADYGRKAKEIYQELVGKTPNIIFQDRLKELRESGL